jgi:hypothetical protein
MCMHCLGHFSSWTPPQHPPCTLSFPLPPQFQAGPILPLSLILLKKRHKHNKEDNRFATWVKDSYTEIFLDWFHVHMCYDPCWFIANDLYTGYWFPPHDNLCCFKVFVKDFDPKIFDTLTNTTDTFNVWGFIYFYSLFILSFLHLLTCVYIVWATFPHLPTPPTLHSP